MAQVPEVTTEYRALVLDVNILLRGVLGTRVRSLIERYADEVLLITPQSCVDDAREYLPGLCAKRKWPVAPAIELLEVLLTGVQVIEDALLGDLEKDARKRIAERDPMTGWSSRLPSHLTPQCGPRTPISSAPAWRPGRRGT